MKVKNILYQNNFKKTEQIKMLILKEHTMKKNYIKLGLTLLSVMNFSKILMIIILKEETLLPNRLKDLYEFIKLDSSQIIALKSNFNSKKDPEKILDS